MIYQLAFQQLGVLHKQNKDLIERGLSFSVVESGFEPEVFKTAFKEW